MRNHMLRAASNSLQLDYIGTTISTANNTTYTFSSVNFGTAFTGRVLFVAIHSYNGSSAARSISSVTIGGVSATQRANNVSGGSTQSIVAVYGAPLDTGSTGNVVVTHNAGMQNCAVSVYSLKNANTLSYPENRSGVTTSGSYTTTLNIEKNDCSIFVSRIQSGNVGTGAYSSPFVKNFDGNIETTIFAGTTASANLLTTNSSYAFSFSATASIPLGICGVTIRST